MPVWLILLGVFIFAWGTFHTRVIFKKSMIKSLIYGAAAGVFWVSIIKLLFYDGVSFFN